ncbi:MAG TPA: Ig-like domain-containing protein, partial [Spirochaetia bacterium]|nr:Ig-like domain-containing protein [Spirochaetia bacterium]
VESATPYTVKVKASDLGQTFADDPTQNIPVVSNLSSAITIIKDDAPPSVAVSTIDNGLGPVATLQGAYINGQLTLTGTSSSGVGVQKVEARLVGVGAGTFSTVTNTGTNYSAWSWVQTGLSIAASSVNLEVRATDNDGRQTVLSYPILIDNTAPTISIDTPSANPDTGTGAYNGTMTIKGSAADNVQVAKVYYQITASDPGTPDAAFTGWTQAGTTYSWSIPIDTKTLNPGSTDQSFTLWVLSVDETAHPSNRSSLTFKVNQSSDKPVITLSVPTSSQVFDTSATATGTVTDDDGLSTIEVSINGGAFSAVSSPATISGKTINWSHVLSSLSDGSYTIQVRARDSNFVSTGTTPNNETLSAVIPFVIDSTPPALSLTKLDVQARYSGDSDKIVTSNFNGTYINNDTVLTFSATSANGIASVQVSKDGGTTYTNATSAGAGSYTYPLTVDLIGNTFDGTRNLNYKAVDAYGKTTTGVLTVVVDTIAPVPTFTSPASMPSSASLSAP